MTALQVDYWKMQEAKRHNLATEGEDERHNLRTEELKKDELTVKAFDTFLKTVSSNVGNVAKLTRSL